MKCAWNELLAILPPQIRRGVDGLCSKTLLEVRLRLGRQPELVLLTGSRLLQGDVTSNDLLFVVNTASKYSPWASSSIGSGCITAAGGHRVGLCGECIVHDGVMTGIRNVTSVCIRVARDVTGIAPVLRKDQGSVLILGPPGSGKTTLLRDAVRLLSETEPVTVVDERGEVFPVGCGFSLGAKTDVLTGCSKLQGITAALRVMGPSCIAVDEITAQQDCQALMEAGWCGVRLIATAHAGDKQDFLTRAVYAPLAAAHLFDTLLILRPDKSWKMERM